MKKLISLTMTTFLATIAISMASSNASALVAKEKAVWQAFKDKNSATAKKYLSPQVVTVYAESINGLQAELNSMSTLEMKSFSLRNVKVEMTDANTAILTYKVKIKGTVSGQDISGTYNSGSVWQQTNGEWRAIFHTEMKEALVAKGAAQKKE